MKVDDGILHQKVVLSRNEVKKVPSTHYILTFDKHPKDRCNEAIHDENK